MRWLLEIEIDLPEDTDPEEALYRIERAIQQADGVESTFSRIWKKVTG